METSSTPSRYTLKQVADFCYEHKKHKGFKEFAMEHIAQTIIWADRQKKLHIVADPQGLCGVCVATIHEDLKTIYVHHIVATRNGFPTFIKYVQAVYPEYSVTGLRSSKVITFNPYKLWAIVSRTQTKALTK